MARNIVEIQGGAAAPDPTGKSSKVMSGWVCSLESKEKSKGKSKRGSQEEESCGERKEEEENVGISLTTLGQSTRERSHPSEGYWRVSDCRT